MKKDNKEKNPRLGKVGGQAVLEGVMMRSGKRIAISVRKTDGTIATKCSEFVSAREKNKFFALPLIRGVVSFVESLSMSMTTMNDAAGMLGIEEEDTKFERWLKKKFGKSALDVMMPIAILLGVLLAVGLFIFLPELVCSLIARIAGRELGIWKSAVSGGVKIVIFVGYMLLVSLIPDIRRTFEYHGAEHKSIFCYESGEELTVANVKKQSRFHPRCGTSFMFVMLLIGILVGFLIPFSNALLRTACKLLLLPLVMGLGFEFLMYAGKHDNMLVKILSAPGLWMQRITTNEPDEGEIEVAIASVKAALPEEFPVEAAESAAEAENGAETVEGAVEAENGAEAAENAVEAEDDGAKSEGT